jgi:hypothetical protein
VTVEVGARVVRGHVDVHEVLVGVLREMGVGADGGGGAVVVDAEELVKGELDGRAEDRETVRVGEGEAFTIGLRMRGCRRGEEKSGGAEVVGKQRGKADGGGGVRVIAGVRS